ncbi:iron(III) transport system permease protein [Deinobacterium chartae]|uniref:Iron(III) transport system permease protein n=1 Tax=Deinobacterium chartae TaxID=521158 RepID=A0A841HX76_9DEIO|nr:iron ABC transporter permease [Deinobacterium chartae]MBB6098131.1 iron(III) transport system permease protein [Deinobacterium chartae]
MSHAVIKTASTRQRRVSLPPYLTLPAALVGGAVLLPLAYLLLRASEVGPRALEFALAGRTLEVLGNTALLTALVTLLSTVLSLPLAWLTAATDLPGRRAWGVLLALPMVFPSFVGGYVVLGALGHGGLLDAATGVRWEGVYGLGGATLALTLFTYPYVYLALRAALRDFDPALWEAARSLGHGGWSAFGRTVLPALRPALTGGGLLVALYTVSDFGAVALLQYDTFSRAIYVQYQGAFDRSLAAVLALVLVGFAALLMLLEARLRGPRVLYRSGSGTRRPPLRVLLGPWRWAACTLVAAVTLLALLLPLTVLIVWLLRGLPGLELGRDLLLPAVSSVAVSAAAALLTLLAALPVAILAVRHRSVLSVLIERLAFSGNALPPIVVALSLVFFGARYLPGLYQTFALLLFAYTVRFLPQTLAVLRTALLGVNPHLEEAARLLGCSAAQATWRVTVPLLRSGALAAAALTFLTTMKELPVTLLLAPTGFETLATEVWAAASEAFFARAAAPALLLVAASTAAVALILRGEREPQ